MGYADLCLCHSQSCTTSSSTVGLTCCSTSVVISSSMRTALVVMPRICAQSPSSSAIFTPVLFAEEAPRLQLVHQQKIVEAAQFPRLVRQES